LSLEDFIGAKALSETLFEIAMLKVSSYMQKKLEGIMDNPTLPLSHK